MRILLLAMVVIASAAAADSRPAAPANLRFGSGRTVAADVRVREVLSDIPVSALARNLFSTPIALCDDKLIVASVEDGPDAPRRLSTVVRLGEPQSGRWKWRQILLEPRTLPDITHTQPSVGVDSKQSVHIAYNMHNMPWQYVKSRQPCSIDSFEFLGRAVSDAELQTVFEENRTPFADTGSALIPGNQVSYPAFFNDRNGDLYITYRFAVRPARPWLERAFGGGIARFDTSSQRWQAVGGEVPLTRQDAIAPQSTPAKAFPFTWEPGWSVYHPRLWFDRNNAMYVTWMWREKQAGIETSHPSFAVRASATEPFRRVDGTAYSLPIRLPEAGIIDAFDEHHVFHAGTSITTNIDNEPLVVLESEKPPRVFAGYDHAAGKWKVLEATPYGAAWVVCEDDGSCWAYASGPHVFRRRKDQGRWQMVYQEDGYCDPKPLHLLRERRRFLHVTRCDQRAAKVYEILDASGGGAR
jgi:hypothetical protein